MTWHRLGEHTNRIYNVRLGLETIHLLKCWSDRVQIHYTDVNQHLRRERRIRADSASWHWPAIEPLQPQHDAGTHKLRPETGSGGKHCFQSCEEAASELPQLGSLGPLKEL